MPENMCAWQLSSGVRNRVRATIVRNMTCRVTLHLPETAKLGAVHELSFDRRFRLRHRTRDRPRHPLGLPVDERRGDHLQIDFERKVRPFG